ncbi:MAG: hypothetical protein DME21_04840 [Verrucomicrobia bacterium]|nr:MAG: hypothetical protein DME21_04840 [Verrucomicrobiota bacterium]
MIKSACLCKPILQKFSVIFLKYQQLCWGEWSSRELVLARARSRTEEGRSPHRKGKCTTTVACRGELRYLSDITVNPETLPPRPNHVLATYRWPLAIIALGLLALFAFLAFLWVTGRDQGSTESRPTENATCTSTNGCASR